MTVELEERNYRIGEVAERVGVTTRTIRYYEERGLLGRAPHARKERIGSTARPMSRASASWSACATCSGLSLDELLALAEVEEARERCATSGPTTRPTRERLRIVEAAIPLVERQLELVRTRQQRLTEFSDELSNKLRSLRKRRAELKGGA